MEIPQGIIFSICTYIIYMYLHSLRFSEGVARHHFASCLVIIDKSVHNISSRLWGNLNTVDKKSVFNRPEELQFSNNIIISLMATFLLMLRNLLEKTVCSFLVHPCWIIAELNMLSFVWSHHGHDLLDTYNYFNVKNKLPERMTITDVLLSPCPTWKYFYLHSFSWLFNIGVCLEEGVIQH